MSHRYYFNCSFSDEGNEDHKIWIRLFVDKNYSAHCAEWAEAWFALDALMHKTCHIASSIPDPQSDSNISDSIKSVNDWHSQWKERLIIVQANKIEHAGELLDESMSLQFLPIPSSSSIYSGRKETPIRFLDYPPMRITDTFFSNRLNNWRALGLYLSLIQQPLWGNISSKGFVNALDICRTYAAGNDLEKNCLSAEKAIGLYLAGVVFGGPAMHSVL